MSTQPETICGRLCPFRACPDCPYPGTPEPCDPNTCTRPDHAHLPGHTPPLFDPEDTP